MYLQDIEKKLKVSAEVAYSDNPFWSGMDAPCRFEGEVYNCVVRGKVPKEIDGTYYRCMPDFTWAPTFDDDIALNGDGCIDAVRIFNGHVDFKQRYVRTEKFTVERAARQAVYGKYRNRYTDDPRVKDRIHSTANTHIVYYKNQLLALKEDSPPYAMDPDTMETKGLFTYDGQYKSLTHSAHPKIDPRNGEMMTMGYEAKGDATPDVAYYRFDKHGKKLDECWVKAPYAGMMHDMAATDKWVIFVLNPLASVPRELLEKGHQHFAWEKEQPAYFGVLPRHNPKPEEVKWFYFKNSFVGHTGNAFDGDDGCIYLDTPINYENIFFFFPPVGQPPVPPGWTPPVGQAGTQAPIPLDPESKPGAGAYVRWKFDPNATDLYVEPKVILGVEGEMPKIDDRYGCQPYNALFYNYTGGHKDMEAIHMEPDSGRFNVTLRCDVNTGKYEEWFAGPKTSLHESAFIPRSPDAAEGDGYLLTIAQKLDQRLTSIVILDANKVSEGPIAVIDLPFRLRFGIHGSWVPASEFPERKDLCDMSGIPDDVRKEFENSKVNIPEGMPGRAGSGIPGLPSMPGQNGMHLGNGSNGSIPNVHNGAS